MAQGVVVLDCDRAFDGRVHVVGFAEQIAQAHLHHLAQLGLLEVQADVARRGRRYLIAARVIGVDELAGPQTHNGPGHGWCCIGSNG